jgi:hypothetical protein
MAWILQPLQFSFLPLNNGVWLGSYAIYLVRWNRSANVCERIKNSSFIVSFHPFHYEYVRDDVTLISPTDRNRSKELLVLLACSAIVQEMKCGQHKSKSLAISNRVTQSSLTNETQCRCFVNERNSWSSAKSRVLFCLVGCLWNAGKKFTWLRWLWPKSVSTSQCLSTNGPRVTVVCVCVCVCVCVWCNSMTDNIYYFRNSDLLILSFPLRDWIDMLSTTAPSPCILFTLFNYMISRVVRETDTELLWPVVRRNYITDSSFLEDGHVGQPSTFSLV